MVSVCILDYIIIWDIWEAIACAHGFSLHNFYWTTKLNHDRLFGRDINERNTVCQPKAHLCAHIKALSDLILMPNIKAAYKFTQNYIKTLEVQHVDTHCLSILPFHSWPLLIKVVLCQRILNFCLMYFSTMSLVKIISLADDTSTSRNTSDSQ